MATRAWSVDVKSLYANGTRKSGKAAFRYVTIPGENQGGEDEHDEMSRDKEELEMLRNVSSEFTDKVKEPNGKRHRAEGVDSGEGREMEDELEAPPMRRATTASTSPASMLSAANWLERQEGAIVIDFLETMEARLMAEI